MRLRELVRHKLIGSPLEFPALLVRRSRLLVKGLRHPEIRDALREDDFLHEIVRRSVKPGCVCIDVGAHLGATADLFHRLAPGVSHIVIEATKYKADWLRKKYPHARVVEAACSDQHGEVTFYFQPNNSGYSGMALHEAGINSTAGVQAFKVPAVTIDSLVNESDTICMIKMDIEGAELFALRGARATIARHRPLITFECTGSGTQSMHVDPRDLHAFFRTQGYQVHTPKGFLAGEAPLDEPRMLAAMQYPFQAFSFVATSAQ